MALVLEGINIYKSYKMIVFINKTLNVFVHYAVQLLFSFYILCMVDYTLNS